MTGYGVYNLTLLPMNLIDPRSAGFIYVMKARSWEAQLEYPFYKIGLSIHPDVRVEEIQRGAAPFVVIELVFSLPVSSMFDVEQKLHQLFDDKRVHNEWFILQDHELEAVRSLAGQVSEIVRPARVRRAMADIKYQASANAMMTEDSAEPTVTELESLILTYIKHTRKKVNQEHHKLLNSPVVAGGQTYGSPEQLWATDPMFKTWAERQLQALAKINNMNVGWAINALRQYDHPKFGWVKPKTNLVEEYDITYGE